MEATAWQSFWQIVFVFASALFYGTVIVIAVRGSGDIAGMIRKMITRGD